MNKKQKKVLKFILVMMLDIMEEYNINFDEMNDCIDYLFPLVSKVEPWDSVEMDKIITPKKVLKNRMKKTLRGIQTEWVEGFITKLQRNELKKAIKEQYKQAVKECGGR